MRVTSIILVLLVVFAAVESRAFPNCEGASSQKELGDFCVQCTYDTSPRCENEENSYCVDTIGASPFCGLLSGSRVCTPAAKYGLNRTVNLNTFTLANFNAFKIANEEKNRQCRLGIGEEFGISNGKCCDTICRSKACYCPTGCARQRYGQRITVETVRGAQTCMKCCKKCYSDSFCSEFSGPGNIFSSDNQNCCDEVCAESASQPLTNLWKYL